MKLNQDWEFQWEIEQWEWEVPPLGNFPLSQIPIIPIRSNGNNGNIAKLGTWEGFGVILCYGSLKNEKLLH